MGLFDALMKKQEVPEPVYVSDDAIVALADGQLIDVTTVSDPMFAEKMMGDSVAFTYTGNKITICSPANGTISALFPTGHAFGVTMKTGVELLVHIGIDTVNATGDGFRLLGKKQDNTVMAGEPIVEVDLKKLSKKYSMPVMLIVTNANDQTITFRTPCTVKRRESVIL